MKNLTVFFAVLLWIIMSCSNQSHDQSSKDETTLPGNENYPFDDSTGFVPVFNGHDLTEWTMQGKGFWEVKQGEITGQQDPSEKEDSWLFSLKEWTSFALHLEFFMPEKCNSGIAIRMPKDSTGSPDVFGYEVQISDLPQKKLTGSLLHHKESSGNNLHHPNEWNQLGIIGKDEHIQVYLNRQKIFDEKLKGSKKGRIGFQVPKDAEFAKQVVRFRNIRVKDLNFAK